MPPLGWKERARRATPGPGVRATKMPTGGVAAAQVGARPRHPDPGGRALNGSCLRTCRRHDSRFRFLHTAGAVRDRPRRRRAPLAPKSEHATPTQPQRARQILQW
eukprot:scaffold2621_cov31-Tisochrysis_lutea.AAC.11